MDSFLSRLVKNPNLSSTQISALRTAFKTTQTHIATGTSTWNSDLGMQTKAVLTFLVNSGVIDTKSEIQVINNAQLNELLEPAYATTLMENAKKYTKERNKKIQNLELNIEEFKKMGGEYVFSSVKIINDRKNQLELIKVFEDAESAWKIFLYRPFGLEKKI